MSAYRTPEQQEYDRQHTTADGKYCLNPIIKKGERYAYACDNRQKWSEMSFADKVCKRLGGWFGILILFWLAGEFIARVIL